jgi:hypothetical protein
MAIIGDYWDQETMMQVVDLLKEYEELFLSRFYEMNVITISLEAMKIQLKPNDKPVKNRPYRLNLKYKEKICKELIQMLEP